MLVRSKNEPGRYPYRTPPNRLEFVLVVAHLDTIHTDNLVRIGIIVAPVGFEVILAVGQHTASAESTNIVQRIEPEIISIERRIPIDDLHQRSIDRASLISPL